MSVEILVNIDDVRLWSSKLDEITNDPTRRKELTSQAHILWLQRMVKQRKVLFHPDTLDELESSDWQMNDFQKSIAWANIFAIDESEDSKEKFKIWRTKLSNRYGKDWWEATYLHIKPIYAAHQRLKKRQKSSAPMIDWMNSRSSIVMLARHEELTRILEDIPRK